MDKKNRTINHISLFFLKTYKKVISPVLLLFFGGACKYQPTCSDYAQDSVKKHGILKGALLSCYRVLRCNPLSKGGYDPA